jgi:hypothetical protein
MLQRFLIHFSLVLLFAFTQIGIATHEISHSSEKQQSQQDKNTHGSQCEKCISYANAAASGLAHAFVFDVATTNNSFEVGLFTRSQSSTTFAYSARAPPSSIQA